ncbi:MAG: hypothetical protein PHP00_04450 [Thiotrichaceae bacterium]|nr:hypothetical protein [Thiotrichaceae bacterium]
MSTQEAYKQKIEAELVVAESKLTEFKAQVASLVADERIKHTEELGVIEEQIASTKAKLKELGDADETVWEQMKDGVESAWTSLSNGVHDLAAKFKS